MFIPHLKTVKNYSTYTVNRKSCKSVDRNFGCPTCNHDVLLLPIQALTFPDLSRRASFGFQESGWKSTFLQSDTGFQIQVWSPQDKTFGTSQENRFAPFSLTEIAEDPKQFVQYNPSLLKTRDPKLI